MQPPLSDGPAGRVQPPPSRDRGRPSRPPLNGVALEYAPPLPVHHRRTFTRSLLAVLVLGLALAGPRWLPPAWRQVELLYWQHQCLTVTAPPDTAAVERDAAAPSAGYAGDADFRRFYALLSPPGDRGAPVVFVHERRAPNGRPRLVVVQAYTLDLGVADGDAADALTLSFQARVFRPGGIGRRPTEVLTRGSGAALVELIRPTQIYAGQCDPTDASHFTFNCVLGDRSFTVDGWLGDDETVALQVRRPSSLTPAPPPAAPRRTAAP